MMNSFKYINLSLIMTSNLSIFILVHVCFQLTVITFAHMSVSEFYPFGNQTGDEAMFKNDDSSTSSIPISTSFPFFNHQHKSLIVSTNGAISFLKPVSTYTPSPFPLDDDRRLLTPFWGDVDTREGGTVWYRESTDTSIRDRATAEIRRYFPEFFRFTATWVFIATWDNVAFYGCSYVGCKKRNTFQAILVTNGQHSFTIFNYANITWTTGTASDGDRDTGLGGTPAQVGFNAGKDDVYYAVPSSRTSDIIHINDMTNVNEPGKFVFRIDKSTIQNGGCNINGTLTITPRYGPMLGGHYLMVSGPCLEDSTDIKIQYSNISQSFVCERKSSYSIVCITPMFSATGDIDVYVYISFKTQTDEKHFKGHYMILNPADSKMNVYRHDGSEWSNGQHEISWNKDAPELCDDPYVDIHAFTIKEEGNMLRWTKTTLKEGVQRVAGRTNIDLNLVESIVALRVTSRIQQPRDMPDRGIWSDIFPVVPTQNQAKLGCQNWLRKQDKMPPWTPVHEEPCPCTLQQALLDITRYQPDPDCNMLTSNRQRNIPTCLYRKDAKHCVRLARPPQDGSDNICCYDTNETLIDTKNKEGGTVQRYHFYGGDRNIPYISNFYYDVVPYLQCCRYSQRIRDGAIIYSLCQDYLRFRKPSSCTNYVPPRPARTNGDPHLTTFDGLDYTFNGVGEFHYLLTTDKEFISQIRFEQFSINGTLVKASVATALAARIENITVEVRLNSIRTLDIFLNGRQLEMDETSFLRYNGLSIIDATNDTVGNTERKDYFLIFPSVGISFKLYGSASLLNIIPLISNSDLKGKISGLLGNYDDDKSNDLITSLNTTVPFDSSSEKIYNDFGMTWRIKRSETIFSYEEGKNFDYYQKPGFTPVFKLPEEQIPETAKTACENDTDCLFDFQITGSTEIAALTREIDDLFRIEEDSAQIVRTCENLPSSPNHSNGRWVASNGTLNGSMASFECIDGYYINSTNPENVMCYNGLWQSAFRSFSCQLNSTYVSETVRRRRRLTVTRLIISSTLPTQPISQQNSATISPSATKLTVPMNMATSMSTDTRKQTTSKPPTSAHHPSRSPSRTATDINMRQSLSENEKSISDDKITEKDSEINTLKFMMICIGGGLAFNTALMAVASLIICHRISLLKNSLKSTGSSTSSWHDLFPTKNKIGVVTNHQ